MSNSLSQCVANNAGLLSIFSVKFAGFCQLNLFALILLYVT